MNEYDINPKRTKAYIGKTLDGFITQQESLKRRKVMINGVVYSSILDASRSLLMIESEVIYRCKSKDITSWTFVD